MTPDPVVERVADALYARLDLNGHTAQGVRETATYIVGLVTASFGSMGRALDVALDGLDSIAGDKTPEFFPETSYDCAKRVAAKVRAALNHPQPGPNDALEALERIAVEPTGPHPSRDFEARAAYWHGVAFSQRTTALEVLQGKLG